MLNSETMYQDILSFTKELHHSRFFKRVEFINVFPEAEPLTEQHHLNEYWVYRMMRDIKNKHIFGVYHKPTLMVIRLA